MAIAFDTNSGAVGLSVSSISWSHTCTGANRFLFVKVGTGALAPNNTSSVTYNSVGATEQWDLTASFAHGSGHTLVAPATGANTVAVTLGGADDEVICTAVSHTGVDQTTPIGTPVTDTSTSASGASCNVSSAAGEVVIDGFYGSNLGLGDSATVGAGQTEREKLQDAGDGFGINGISEEAGAASVTMSWSFTSATPYVHGALPLKPAGAGLTQIQPVPPVLWQPNRVPSGVVASGWTPAALKG